MYACQRVYVRICIMYLVTYERVYNVHVGLRMYVCMLHGMFTCRCACLHVCMHVYMYPMYVHLTSCLHAPYVCVCMYACIVCTYM